MPKPPRKIARSPAAIFDFEPGVALPPTTAAPHAVHTACPIAVCAPQFQQLLRPVCMAKPHEVHVAAPGDTDVPHCVQKVPPVEPVLVIDTPRVWRHDRRRPYSQHYPSGASTDAIVGLAAIAQECVEALPFTSAKTCSKRPRILSFYSQLRSRNPGSSSGSTDRDSRTLFGTWHRPSQIRPSPTLPL